MEKREGNMRSCLRPMPPIIVSCRGKDGKDNALVVGYAANCSFDPPMVIIGVREERFSHHMIKETGVFVANIATKANKSFYDYFGSVSGRIGDKFEKTGVRTKTGDVVDAPLLLDCPVNIECRVVDSIITGSHELFIAKVEKVHADKALVDRKGVIDYSKLDYYI